jgi:hypothetical protein
MISGQYSAAGEEMPLDLIVELEAAGANFFSGATTCTVGLPLMVIVFGVLLA